MRSVPEWIATHDDQAIPPRVRLRVFERFNGVCQLTGVKIQVGDQWDVDHRIALILGGEHRESNLVPVLRAAHRVKSAAEMPIKAKIQRIKLKHRGAFPPAKRKLQGRGFEKRWMP